MYETNKMILSLSFLQTVLHYVLKKSGSDGVIALDTYRSIGDGRSAAVRRYTNFEKIRETEMNYRSSHQFNFVNKLPPP